MILGNKPFLSIFNKKCIVTNTIIYRKAWMKPEEDAKIKPTVTEDDLNQIR